MMTYQYPTRGTIAGANLQPIKTNYIGDTLFGAEESTIFVDQPSITTTNGIRKSTCQIQKTPSSLGKKASKSTGPLNSLIN